MMSDLEKAKRRLASGDVTCVLCNGDELLTSTERGVKPLVVWMESGAKPHGWSAADKVVGKGAAFLYVLLGVTAVYAQVISRPALALLQRHGVTVEYGTAVAHIINRRGDGICPFELAVWDVEGAEEAYAVIRRKVTELNIRLEPDNENKK